MVEAAAWRPNVGRARYVNENWTVAYAQLPIEAQEGETSDATNPWLTVMTDTFSRCVVGFHLGLQPPSASSVLSAFRMGIRPKRDLPGRHYSEMNRWACSGIPDCLEVDRSLYGSKDLEDESMDLMVTMRFTRLRKAWFQAPLSEWFGRFVVTGSLEAAGYEWLDHERSGTESIPPFMLGDVEGMLVTWIVDYYHETVHSSLGCTPSKKWALGLKNTFIRSVTG